MNKVTFLLLSVFVVFCGYCISSSEAGDPKRCVNPLIDIFLGNTTLKAGSIVCKKRIVNYVFSLGIDSDDAHFPPIPAAKISYGSQSGGSQSDSLDSDDEDSESMQSTHTAVVKYVVTGVTSSSLSTNIVKIIASVRPSGDGKIKIEGISIETKTSNGVRCFDADTIVSTKSGSKQITQLKVGDMIRTGANSFVEMEGWLHRDPELVSTFITISSENSSTTMVDEHFVMIVKNCNIFGYETPVFASNVKIGDCFVMINEDDQVSLDQVINIEYAQKTGVYSPYINSDTMFVTTPLNPTKFIMASPFAYTYPSEAQQIGLALTMKATAMFQDQDSMIGVNAGVDTVCEMTNWCYPSDF